MTKDELKQRVYQAIEQRGEEIIGLGEEIRRHPELGFKEVKTARLAEETFKKLGLAPRSGLAMTGVRAEVAGHGGEGAIDVAHPGDDLAVVESDREVHPHRDVAADPFEIRMMSTDSSRIGMKSMTLTEPSGVSNSVTLSASRSSGSSSAPTASLA